MCFSATVSFSAGAFLLGVGALTPRSAVVAINALMLKRTKLAGIRQVRAEGTGSVTAGPVAPAHNS